MVRYFFILGLVLIICVPISGHAQETVQNKNDEFSALMKNLQEPANKNDVPYKEVYTSTTRRNLTEDLSILSTQIMECWVIPKNVINKNDEPDMKVALDIWPTIDGNVKNIEVSDAAKQHMETDPVFKELVDSAYAAVSNPKCHPLKLPMDKIDVWKDKYITIDFDPRHVI